MNASIRKELAELAQSCGSSVQEDELLARHTTFRIGGPAALFIEIASADGLAALRARCAETGTRCFILGNGSNLLAADEGFDGVVLHPAAPEFTVLTRQDSLITAGAGLKLSALTACARDCRLSGLEFAHGIPGSVGGAAYMNAGAYGGEFSQVLHSCAVLLPDGTRRTLRADEMDYGYRHSLLMENGATVISVCVQLTPDSTPAIGARMDDYLARRKAKQPLEYPSAGSVFKRPAGHFAGALIEQCGLKGRSVGGAQVSEKHAGFIINRGGATAHDVLSLIDLIRSTVLAETGISLECELLRLS